MIKLIDNKLKLLNENTKSLFCHGVNNTCKIKYEVRVKADFTKPSFGRVILKLKPKATIIRGPV